MSYYSKKYLEILKGQAARGDTAAERRLQTLMAMPAKQREEEAQWWYRDMTINRAIKRENFLNFYNQPTLYIGEEELAGLQAIADHLHLTLDQIKYRSEELQEVGLLRWKLKGKGRKRRWILVGYASDIKVYLHFFPKKPLKSPFA